MAEKTLLNIIGSTPKPKEPKPVIKETNIITGVVGGGGNTVIDKSTNTDYSSSMWTTAGSNTTYYKTNPETYVSPTGILEGYDVVSASPINTTSTFTGSDTPKNASLGDTWIDDQGIKRILTTGSTPDSITWKYVPDEVKEPEAELKLPDGITAETDGKFSFNGQIYDSAEAAAYAKSEADILEAEGITTDQIENGSEEKIVIDTSGEEDRVTTTITDKEETTGEEGTGFETKSYGGVDYTTAEEWDAWTENKTQVGDLWFKDNLFFYNPETGALENYLGYLSDNNATGLYALPDGTEYYYYNGTRYSSKDEWSAAVIKEEGTDGLVTILDDIETGSVTKDETTGDEDENAGGEEATYVVGNTTYTEEEFNTVYGGYLEQGFTYDPETGTLKAPSDDATLEQYGIDTSSYIYSWDEDARAMAEAEYGLEVAKALQDAIAARQDLATARATAINSFYGSEYASASMIDKFGWSGGAESDERMRIAYLQASVNAQMLNQKDLILAGYESDLAVAREYANVNLIQLAQEAYAQAEITAINRAEMTGVYISPEMEDVTANYLALPAEDRVEGNVTYDKLVSMFEAQGITTLEERTEWLDFYKKYNDFVLTTDRMLAEEALAKSKEEYESSYSTATVDGEEKETIWDDRSLAFYEEDSNALYEQDGTVVPGMDNYIEYTYTDEGNTPLYKVEPYSDEYTDGNGNFYIKKIIEGQSFGGVSTPERIEWTLVRSESEVSAATELDSNEQADLLVKWNDNNTFNWTSADFETLINEDYTKWKAVPQTVYGGTTTSTSESDFYETSTTTTTYTYETASGKTLTQKEYDWLLENVFNK